MSNFKTFIYITVGAVQFTLVFELENLSVIAPVKIIYHFCFASGTLGVGFRTRCLSFWSNTLSSPVRLQILPTPPRSPTFPTIVQNFTVQLSTSTLLFPSPNTLFHFFLILIYSRSPDYGSCWFLQYISGEVVYRKAKLPSIFEDLWSFASLYFSATARF